MNSPDFTASGLCSFAASFPPDNNDPCVGNWPSWGGAVIQFRLDRADSTGRNARALAQPLSPLHYWFAGGAQPTPDGKWLIFQTHANAHQDLLGIQVPPLPGDSLTPRNDFIQVPVQPTPVAGAVHTIIEFGYDMNPYCTSRQESCVAASSTYSQSTPFYYQTTEAGSYTGADCSSSCTIIVPVIPMRVAYWRPIYRDVNNNVLSTGGWQVALDANN